MSSPAPKRSGLFSLLLPYKGLIIALTVFSIIANALTLWLPKLTAQGINAFVARTTLDPVLWKFGAASVVIFIFTYLQSIVQTYASEKVAKDMRNELSEKISMHSFADVQEVTPAKLLTNLTSDVDSVKNFVSQAVVSIISSVLLIVGGGYLLISIDWKLGLVVLSIVPIIGATFGFILGKVRTLFLKGREVVDRLNKTINESILGAALIRVVNSQNTEHKKFSEVNAQARDLGLSILKLFSTMIPIVTFITNLATLAILLLGGKFVIGGAMTLGDFAAFQSYLTIIVFPVFILGFVSNIIAQSQASYGRISAVLTLPPGAQDGALSEKLEGRIDVRDITLNFGEKSALKHVSFSVAPGSKTAIIGPTAAGKTQLMNLLIGLTAPTSGEILYDGRPLLEYKRENLYKQIGLVFQDSIIFNISLRENIAFNTQVTEEDLQRAIETAELKDFVSSLPDGLGTLVSERGTSLSGGQKQRVMLARALAIHPTILLLDDFTARVDTSTEKKILANIAKNYPDLTLVSVTQKIASVEDYDQIVVLMEGEVVGAGTHKALLDTSPEYVQIFNSQQSTNAI
jgi:ATP-binding cassette subfamily B protein